jgi:23S rRNA pseudouridine2605 synthase
MKSHKTDKPKKEATLRLNKLITTAGIASRRDADKLIIDAEVSVNGAIVTNPGTKVSPGVDSVKVSGKLITRKEPKAYYIFHKPPKTVSTLFDPQTRPCVKDFIKNIKTRVLPVGSLSYEGCGAMLLTNDGDLIDFLNNSNTKLLSSYRIKISGLPEVKTIPALIKKLKSIDKNKSSVRVRISKKTFKNSWIEILTTVTPKKLEIIFKNMGFPILKLVRIKFAEISIKTVAPGRYRALDKNEIAFLQANLRN